MKDATQLKTHVIKTNFPGRTFAQLFSRYHYLRMKQTTPQKYIEDLKVSEKNLVKRAFYKCESPICVPGKN